MESSRTESDGTVFISYRRNLSSEAANLVLQRLEDSGFDVFIDWRGLESGEFTPAIMNAIATRKFFVVVLEPGSLDHIENGNDWLRREIAQALHAERAIVPFLTRGFDLAESTASLPHDINRLVDFNAITVLDGDYAEALRKLVKFLGGRRRRFDLRQICLLGGIAAPGVVIVALLQGQAATSIDSSSMAGVGSDIRAFGTGWIWWQLLLSFLGFRVVLYLANFLFWGKRWPYKPFSQRFGVAVFTVAWHCVWILVFWNSFSRGMILSVFLLGVARGIVQLKGRWHMFDSFRQASDPKDAE